MSDKKRKLEQDFKRLSELCLELDAEKNDLKAKYEKAVSALKFYSSGEFPWSKDSEYDNGEMADSTLEELGEK